MATNAKAATALRTPARNAADPNSMCDPAANISRMKPIDDSEGRGTTLGSIQPKPLLPMIRPAPISPTTTGTIGRRPAARSGPARLAATTRASVANIRRSIAPAARSRPG